MLLIYDELQAWTEIAENLTSIAATASWGPRFYNSHMISERYKWGLLPPQSQVDRPWSLVEDHLLLSFLPSHVPGGLDTSDGTTGWPRVAHQMNAAAESCNLKGRVYTKNSVTSHYNIQLSGHFQQGEIQHRNEPPWSVFENELLLERLSSHMSGGRSSNHVASWQSVAESLQRAADFYHMNNRGYSAATVCYHYYAAMYRFQEAPAAIDEFIEMALDATAA
jgi:hypothetical protein